MGDKVRDDLERSQASAGKYQIQTDKAQSQLDKTQSEFDRMQEKFERSQNEIRKTERTRKKYCTISMSYRHNLRKFNILLIAYKLKKKISIWIWNVTEKSVINSSGLSYKPRPTRKKRKRKY